MKYSIVIPTYNRARDIEMTLESLSELKTNSDWEVVIADNNSSDDTESVVRAAMKSFPTKLQYVFEGEQGRSAALNAAIRASSGEIILTTDDDVRVDPNWLEAATRAIEDRGYDYAGGRVLPVWGGRRPAWLPNRGGRHWAVIALLDYGDQALELGNRPALGVNMAFSRRAFDKAGLWDNRVGRRAGTLLGQEVREWALRATAAGLRGCYEPSMLVHHVIPPDRLTRRYFRRWFYWNGISRAILYSQSAIDMESPESRSIDFSTVPHVAGVPRYLYRTCAKSVIRMLKAVGRDPVARFENELWLWFFAGIVRQRVKDNRKSKRLQSDAVAEADRNDTVAKLPTGTATAE